MTARKYDIAIDQGATFELAMVYKDAAGVVVNLTGYTVAMQIRASVGGKMFASATTANGRITVNASGNIAIAIPAAETANINVEQAVYDLFLHAPGGDPVKKLLYGDAVVNPSVTR
jgi:hypothetical protein